MTLPSPAEAILTRLRDQAAAQAEQHLTHHRIADAGHAARFAADCQADLDRLTASQTSAT